jgi:KDO2-lipid IV(A) lauroyltransferase
VVLFASHTGNWEIAAAAAARLLEERHKKLFIVAKPMHDRGVEAFLSRLRSSLNVQTVRPEGVMAAAREVLEAGDVVAMPIDQVPDRASHGTSLSFLGNVALVDRAPATLAWRAQASVLVVAADREGAVHRVRVLETLRPPSKESAASARAWIDATTSRATFVLEAFVRRTPQAWLWLHRRWRAPRRAGAVSRASGSLPPPLLSRAGMRASSMDHHG